MIRTLIATGMVSLLLTACTTVPPKDSDATAVVRCMSPDDCDQKWRRAAGWIERHSPWPIRTRTATRIETERARTRYFQRTYFLITRTAGQINFEASCLPSVYCSPDLGGARRDFVGFVETGGSP